MAKGQTLRPVSGRDLSQILRPAMPADAQYQGREAHAAPMGVVLALSLIAVALAGMAMGLLGLLTIGAWRLACAIPVPSALQHLAQGMRSLL